MVYPCDTPSACGGELHSQLGRINVLPRDAVIHNNLFEQIELI